MEALDLYEAGFCRQCGNPLEVCRDPEAVVMVDTDTCMFARATAVQRRRDEAEHEKDKPRPGQPHWDDGRISVPRLATPEEIKQALRPTR